jgi:hypothetical protein
MSVASKDHGSRGAYTAERRGFDNRQRPLLFENGASEDFLPEHDGASMAQISSTLPAKCARARRGFSAAKPRLPPPLPASLRGEVG